MDRLRFGAFLAPHHPTGEHPTLLFQRDLDLVAHLDRLAGDVPRRRRSSEPHDPPRHRRDQPARPPPVQSATARTTRSASSISPSGMQLAGKYGIGVLSVAFNSTEGLQALPTQ